MDIREIIRLRQLIWAEYRTGNNKSQAQANILAKLGPNCVSKSFVKNCYKRFGLGHICLFDPDTKQYGIVQAIQTLLNGHEIDFSNTLLFVLNDDKWAYQMDILNKRFAIFVGFHPTNGIKIVSSDLLNGKTKDVVVLDETKYGTIFSVKMIGEQHLVIISLNTLLIVKIDVESKAIYSSWSHDLKNRACWITIDQLDKNRFLVCSSWLGLITGNLVNNEVVMTLPDNLMICNLRYPKLSGNKLFGFLIPQRPTGDDAWVWKFSELYLKETAYKLTEVPVVIHKSRSLDSAMTDVYCWCENRLYIAFSNGNSQERVVVFDSETLKWTEIGITVYGGINAMFVDDTKFLTLQASSSSYTAKSSIYRFALKKPDSLKNIVWLAIRRYSILFNSEAYKQICDKFPEFNEAEPPFIVYIKDSS